MPPGLTILLHSVAATPCTFQILALELGLKPLQLSNRASCALPMEMAAVRQSQTYRSVRKAAPGYRDLSGRPALRLRW